MSFFSVLSDTWYGAQTKAASLEEKPDLEILYGVILAHIHRTAARRNPYSIATLYSYLYFKEEELRKIITVIEGIRYHLGAGEILDIIEKEESGGNTP